jgi:demethylmenaquinone methyltransferase/2-methoxy-6-polyprenyl-1,4-benzoquinol methylase
VVVPHDELDVLVAEQTAYYRARAGEYDTTSALDAGSRAELVAALETFAPRGRVLELACGTGEWTVELVKHATELTAVDLAPEMLALNAQRVGAADVRYLQVDLFAWTPAQRYDVVFFSAWLSHVPPQGFEAFWALVAACLNDGGRVFVIDELPAVAAHEQPIADAAAVSSASWPCAARCSAPHSSSWACSRSPSASSSSAVSNSETNRARAAAKLALDGRCSVSR